MAASDPNSKTESKPVPEGRGTGQGNARTVDAPFELGDRLFLSAVVAGLRASMKRLRS